MTYEEANEILMKAITEIQKEASAELLHAVVQNAHVQVSSMFDWMLKNKFNAEQVEINNRAKDTAVTDVDAQPVQ